MVDHSTVFLYGRHVDGGARSDADAAGSFSCDPRHRGVMPIVYIDHAGRIGGRRDRANPVAFGALAGDGAIVLYLHRIGILALRTLLSCNAVTAKDERGGSHEIASVLRSRQLLDFPCKLLRQNHSFKNRFQFCCSVLQIGYLCEILVVINAKSKYCFFWNFSDSL